MLISQMGDAISEANAVLNRADMCVEKMIEILAQRKLKRKYLEHSFRYACNLARIKRELRDFNIHTKRWSK